MRSLALALAVSIALLPCAADAQRRGRRARAAPSSSAAEYRTTIREAVSEFDAGRWAEARALFRRAHELEPSARTLRGIGMCSFELREYAAAIRELGDALAERRRALTRAQRRAAERLIARAGGFVGRFTIDVRPADAAVTIDAAPAQSGELVLDLGHHVLRAEREGHRGVERRIDVEGGERETIRLQLERASVADVIPPPVARPAADPWPVAAPLLIAGGAMIGVGVGAAVWLVDRDHELGICDAAGPDCVNRDALATQRDASLGVTAAAFVAAGALGATALIWALAAPAPAQGGEHALACAPSLTGIACRATF